MSWSRLVLAVMAVVLAAVGAQRLAKLAQRTGERGETEASIYVFGRLERPGDVSSFRLDRRWHRISEGRGPERAVRLVVVAPEVTPGSLHSQAEVSAAAAEGRVVVLETPCTVPAARAHSFSPSCATQNRNC